MSPQQIKDVVIMYSQRLQDTVIEKHGKPLQHTKWMCYEVEKMVDELELISECVRKDYSKINRWLGFIQGVLYCDGVYTIDEMREHNRKELNNEKL